MCA
ncbi:hypothetical protein VCCP103710_1986, partial [Vibrio cholerae CP1037(10)]|jgi:hypothetical protein